MYILQVAGQVVATWGPRPGNGRSHTGRPEEYNMLANEYHGAGHLGVSNRSNRKKHGYQHNRHVSVNSYHNCQQSLVISVVLF